MSTNSIQDLLLREYQPGDEVQILRSFNRVIGALDPHFVPKDMATWRWEFLENPAGTTITIAFTPTGEVAGQVGFLPQRMWLEGAPGIFSSGVDHFTDPAFRSSLKRESLLSLMGNRVADVYGGAGPEKHAVMWGLPVQAAWRVGKNSIRYEVVRIQQKLFAPLHVLRAAATRGVEVEEVSRFPDDVTGLFGVARAAYTCIAVRDREVLDWRFVACPHARYRIGLARRRAELVGYAVYRKGAFDGVGDEGLLIDWLTRPGDEGARDALLAWASHVARAEAAERLVFVVSDCVPEWGAFQERGFRAAPTRYFPIARHYVPRYHARWLARHWYYTLGDSDLA